MLHSRAVILNSQKTPHVAPRHLVLGYAGVSTAKGIQATRVVPLHLVLDYAGVSADSSGVSVEGIQISSAEGM